MASEEEERQWSDLPELILQAIAMRLPGPADFLTFLGVCRAWRSSSCFSAKEFFSSLPRPIFCSSLFPFINTPSSPPFSAVLFLYSPRDFDVIYKYHSSAAASDLLSIGQSNGHFIAIDKATRSIVRVINPFTGARAVFPKISFSFEYALLTEADMAHPDCRLVLVHEKNNHIFYCLTSGGLWQTINFWLKNLTDAISYKGRLYLVRYYDQIFEYDFGTNLFHEFSIRVPFCGTLAESSYGDLVMLRTGSPSVVCWRVMPAPKKDANGEDNNWDRFFEWPAGKNLMFRWQRTDASGCPKLATMHKRRKVVVIDQHTSFWKNYMECSLPCSNGVYVVVDDHGRPTLSNFVTF